jgi:hypothetical protein
MCGGGIFQKPNTQGLGAGVIPSAATLNSRDYLISQGRGASWENPNARSVNPHMEWKQLAPTYGGTRTPSREYTADEIAALKLEYDNAEALRQDKLDKMSQLAQGKGGSGGGVRGQIVGDGGDLNIQQVAMNRGKDGFPTLADFEQPLHPFLWKRRQRYS